MVRGRPRGPQSQKMRFWQKYKMAASHFVCERIFLVKKQKWSLLGRLSWSTKSGAISTKNGQVMAIFSFLPFSKIGNLAFFTIQHNFFKWDQRSPMKKILTFFSQTQISIVVGTCGENFGPLPCPMVILGAQKVSGRIQPPPTPGNANLPTTWD